LGFPIFPLNWTDPKTGELAEGFRERGYLPEALVNFLAFLGWNPGTEQELFTMNQLIDAFEIERIGKAGARFDIQKAKWYNQQYLRAKSDKELADYLIEGLKKENINCTPDKAQAVVASLRERITFPQDLVELGRFFFVAPNAFDEKIASKKWNQEAILVANKLAETFGNHPGSCTAEEAATVVQSTTENLGIAQGKIMQALRLSLTGGASGPDLMVTMQILGSEEIVRRLQYALKTLGDK